MPHANADMKESRTLAPVKEWRQVGAPGVVSSAHGLLTWLSVPPRHSHAWILRRLSVAPSARTEA